MPYKAEFSLVEHFLTLSKYGVHLIKSDSECVTKELPKNFLPPKYWISNYKRKNSLQQKDFHSGFGLIFKHLKDKSGIDKIIVKKQPYQLLNTRREFFPSFDASNFHKLVNESS